jgi:hypothetical protein
MQKGPEIFTALSSHVRFGSRQVDDPAAVGRVHDKVLFQTAVSFVFFNLLRGLIGMIRLDNSTLICFVLIVFRSTSLLKLVMNYLHRLMRDSIGSTDG